MAYRFSTLLLFGSKSPFYPKPVRTTIVPGHIIALIICSDWIDGPSFSYRKYELEDVLS